MSGQPIAYTAQGYGVDPCPGCGKKPQPQEERIVVPGVWVPWHAVCFKARCSLCGENHPNGSCLL